MANDEIKISGGNINELMDGDVSLDVDVNLHIKGKDELVEVAETIKDINDGEVKVAINNTKVESLVADGYNPHMDKMPLREYQRIIEETLNYLNGSASDFQKAVRQAEAIMLLRNVRYEKFSEKNEDMIFSKMEEIAKIKLKDAPSFGKYGEDYSKYIVKRNSHISSPTEKNKNTTPMEDRESKSIGMTVKQIDGHIKKVTNQVNDYLSQLSEMTDDDLSSLMVAINRERESLRGYLSNLKNGEVDKHIKNLILNARNELLTGNRKVNSEINKRQIVNQEEEWMSELRKYDSSGKSKEIIDEVNDFIDSIKDVVEITPEIEGKISELHRKLIIVNSNIGDQVKYDIIDDDTARELFIKIKEYANKFEQANNELNEREFLSKKNNTLDKYKSMGYYDVERPKITDEYALKLMPNINEMIEESVDKMFKRSAERGYEFVNYELMSQSDIYRSIINADYNEVLRTNTTEGKESAKLVEQALRDYVIKIGDVTFENKGTSRGEEAKKRQISYDNDTIEQYKAYVDKIINSYKGERSKKLAREIFDKSLSGEDISNYDLSQSEFGSKSNKALENAITLKLIAQSINEISERQKKYTGDYDVEFIHNKDDYIIQQEAKKLAKNTSNTKNTTVSNNNDVQKVEVVEKPKADVKIEKPQQVVIVEDKTTQDAIKVEVAQPKVVDNSHATQQKENGLTVGKLSDDELFKVINKLNKMIAEVNDKSLDYMAKGYLDSRMVLNAIKDIDVVKDEIFSVLNKLDPVDANIAMTGLYSGGNLTNQKVNLYVLESLKNQFESKLISKMTSKDGTALKEAREILDRPIIDDISKEDALEFYVEFNRVIVALKKEFLGLYENIDYSSKRAGVNSSPKIVYDVLSSGGIYVPEAREKLINEIEPKLNGNSKLDEVYMKAFEYSEVANRLASLLDSDTGVINKALKNSNIPSLKELSRLTGTNDFSYNNYYFGNKNVASKKFDTGRADVFKLLSKFLSGYEIKSIEDMLVVGKLQDIVNRLGDYLNRSDYRESVVNRDAKLIGMQEETGLVTREQSNYKDSYFLKDNISVEDNGYRVLLPKDYAKYGYNAVSDKSNELLPINRTQLANFGYYIVEKAIKEFNSNNNADLADLENSFKDVARYFKMSIMQKRNTSDTVELERDFNTAVGEEKRILRIFSELADLRLGGVLIPNNSGTAVHSEKQYNEKELKDFNISEFRATDWMYRNYLRVNGRGVLNYKDRNAIHSDLTLADISTVSQIMSDISNKEVKEYISRLHEITSNLNKNKENTLFNIEDTLKEVDGVSKAMYESNGFNELKDDFKIFIKDIVSILKGDIAHFGKLQKELFDTPEHQIKLKNKEYSNIKSSEDSVIDIEPLDRDSKWMGELVNKYTDSYGVSLKDIGLPEFIGNSILEAIDNRLLDDIRDMKLTDISDLHSMIELGRLLKYYDKTASELGIHLKLQSKAFKSIYSKLTPVGENQLKVYDELKQLQEVSGIKSEYLEPNILDEFKNNSNGARKKYSKSSNLDYDIQDYLFGQLGIEDKYFSDTLSKIEKLMDGKYPASKISDVSKIDANKLSYGEVVKALSKLGVDLRDLGIITKKSYAPKIEYNNENQKILGLGINSDIPVKKGNTPVNISSDLDINSDRLELANYLKAIFEVFESSSEMFKSVQDELNKLGSTNAFKITKTLSHLYNLLSDFDGINVPGEFEEKLKYTKAALKNDKSNALFELGNSLGVQRPVIDVEYTEVEPEKVAQEIKEEINKEPLVIDVEPIEIVPTLQGLEVIEPEKVAQEIKEEIQEELKQDPVEVEVEPNKATSRFAVYPNTVTSVNEANKLALKNQIKDPLVEEYFNSLSKEDKKNNGIAYTPKEVSNIVAKRSIEAALKNSLAHEGKEDYFDNFLRVARGIDSIERYDELSLAEFQYILEKLKSFKILEPSAGAGDMVIEIVNYLNDIFSTFGSNEIDHILDNMLYINELDPKALEVLKARFRRDIGREPKNVFNQDYLKWQPPVKFDAIVANPPYVRSERIDKNDKEYYLKEFPNYTKSADLYIAFYDKMFKDLSTNGVLSAITPNKWQRAKYGENLKNDLLQNKKAISLLDFGGNRMFNAGVDTSILTASNNKHPNAYDYWHDSFYNEYDFNGGCNNEKLATYMPRLSGKAIKLDCDIAEEPQLKEEMAEAYKDYYDIVTEIIQIDDDNNSEIEYETCDESKLSSMVIEELVKQGLANPNKVVEEPKKVAPVEIPPTVQGLEVVPIKKIEKPQVVEVLEENTQALDKNTKQKIDLSKELSAEEYVKLSMGDKFQYDMIHCMENKPTQKEDTQKEFNSEVVELKEEVKKNTKATVENTVEEKEETSKVSTEDLLKKFGLDTKQEEKEETPKKEKKPRKEKQQTETEHTDTSKVRSNVDSLMGSFDVADIMRASANEKEAEAKRILAEARLKEAQNDTANSEAKLINARLRKDSREETLANRKKREDGYITSGKYKDFYVGTVENNGKAEFDAVKDNDTRRLIKEFGSYISGLSGDIKKFAGTALGDSILERKNSDIAKFNESLKSKDFNTLSVTLKGILEDGISYRAEINNLKKANVVDKLPKYENQVRGYEDTYNDILGNDDKTNTQKIKELRDLVSGLGKVNRDRNLLDIDEDDTVHKEKFDLLGQSIEQLTQIINKEITKIQGIADVEKLINKADGLDKVLENVISSSDSLDDKTKKLNKLSQDLLLIENAKSKINQNEGNQNKFNSLNALTLAIRENVNATRNSVMAQQYGAKVGSLRQEFDGVMNDNSTSKKDKVTQLTKVNSKINALLNDKESVLANLTDPKDIEELNKAIDLLRKLKADLGGGKVGLQEAIFSEKQLDLLDDVEDKFRAISTEIESFDVSLLGEDDLDSVKRLQSRLNAMHRDADTVRTSLKDADAVKKAEELLKVISKSKLEVKAMGDKIRKSSVGVKTLANGFKSIVDRVDRIGHSLKGVAASVASFLAIKQTVSLIGGRALELEKLNLSFEVLIGNEEKAKRLMKDIQELAQKSPLQITEVSHGANLLLGAGMREHKITELLKQIGDLSQGDSAKFESIARAISQSYGMQRTMGEELRQLEDANVSIRPEIAKNLGITVQELQKMLEKGTLGIDPLLDAIDSLTGDGGRFNGMLDKQSETVLGLFNKVKERLITMGVEATADSFELVGKYLEDILGYLDDIENNFEIEKIAREVARLTERLLSAVVSLFNVIMENREFLMSLLTFIVDALGWCIENSKVLIGLWVSGKLLRGAVAFGDAIFGADKGLIECIKHSKELFKNMKDGKSIGGSLTGGILGSLSGTLSKIGSAVSPYIIPGAIGSAIGSSVVGGYNSMSAPAKNEWVRDKDDKITNAIEYAKSREFLHDLEQMGPMTWFTGNTAQFNLALNQLLKPGAELQIQTKSLQDLITALEKEKALEIEDNNLSKVKEIDRQIARYTKDYDVKNEQLNNIKDVLRGLVREIYIADKDRRMELAAVFSDEIDVLNQLFDQNDVDKDRFQYIADNTDDLAYVFNSIADRVIKAIKETYGKEQDKQKEDIDLQNKENILNSIQESTGKLSTSEAKMQEYQSLSEGIANVINAKKSDLVTGENTVDINTLRTLYDNGITQGFAKAVSDGTDLVTLEVIANGLINKLEKDTKIQGEIAERVKGEIAQQRLNARGLGLGDDFEINNALTESENLANSIIFGCGLIAQGISESLVVVEETVSEYQKYIEQLSLEQGLGKLSSSKYLSRLLIAQSKASTDEEKHDIEKQIYDQRNVILDEKRADIDYNYDLKVTEGRNAKELAINADLHDQKYKQVKAYYDEVAKAEHLGAEDRRQRLQDLELDLKNLATEGKNMRVAVADAEVQEIADKYNRLSSLVDSKRNYSNSWLELNYWSEALTLQEKLQGKIRVFNAQEKQTKDGLLNIDKQIANIKEQSAYSDKEKAEKISELEKQRIDIYTSQKQYQLQMYQEIANQYTSTMTEAINKVYDEEIKNLDRLVKARKEKQEDEDLDKQEKELLKQISNMQGASTLEGKKQLEELEKQLEELKKKREDLEFDRDIENKKEELSNNKDKDMAQLEEKSKAFAQSFNQGILEGISTLEAKLKAIARNVGSDIADSLMADLAKDVNSMKIVNNTRTAITDNRAYTVKVQTDNVAKVDTGKVLYDLNSLPSFGR